MNINNQYRADFAQKVEAMGYVYKFIDVVVRPELKEVVENIWERILVIGNEAPSEQEYFEDQVNRANYLMNEYIQNERPDLTRKDIIEVITMILAGYMLGET